jgi:hypothetical protein
VEPLRAFFSESKRNGLCKNANVYLFAKCVIRLRVRRWRKRASISGRRKIFYFFLNLTDGLEAHSTSHSRSTRGLGRNRRDVQVSVQRDLEPKLRFLGAVFPLTNTHPLRAKGQFHCFKLFIGCDENLFDKNLLYVQSHVLRRDWNLWRFIIFNYTPNYGPRSTKINMTERAARLTIRQYTPSDGVSHAPVQTEGHILLLLSFRPSCHNKRYRTAGFCFALRRGLAALTSREDMKVKIFQICTCQEYKRFYPTISTINSRRTV